MVCAISMVVACQDKELGIYEKPYVVDRAPSLPYYESWQQLNPKKTDEMIRDLIRYDQDESFILVDNEGDEILDQEFARKVGRDFSEQMALANKIKEYPLFFVDEDAYYVTTAKKEVKALLNGKRELVGIDLEEFKRINEEAIEEEDYERIMRFISQKQLLIFNKVEN